MGRSNLAVSPRLTFRGKTSWICWAFPAGLFVLSFFSGFSLQSKVQLPFSNPWRIPGPLATLQYNPANDLIKFAILLFLPTAVLVTLSPMEVFRRSCMNPRRERPCSYSGHSGVISKLLLWVMLLTMLFLVGGYTYRADPLDTFHEGESLGPAVDYLHGKAPYKDAIFIHGVFRDPLRSVFAFKIFGRSIGALRTLDACLGLATLAIFFVASYFLYEKNIHYTALFILALLFIRHIRPFGIPFYFSLVDIGLLTLLTIGKFIQEGLSDRLFNAPSGKGKILLALFAFIPTASFANSVDRGVYLTIAATGFLLLVHLLLLRGTKGRWLWPTLLGFLAGLGLLGIAIKGAYGPFAEYVFRVLPRLDPLMNGFIYPFHDPRFLLPVVCLSGVLYWLVWGLLGSLTAPMTGLLEKAKKFCLRHLMEILLLLLSVACFKRALGRSDLGHLADALGPITILLTYILIRHGLCPILKRIRAEEKVVTGVVVVIFLALAIVLVPKTNWATWYRFSLGMPDEELIPNNYIETIAYLKTHLPPGESFMTMTSEGSWYYFLDRPCPTRFQVIYQAMPPFYQQEVVEDLEAKKVGYILLRNGHWANEMEGFSNEVRIPLVFQYIVKNYSLLTKIEDNEIWIRKKKNRSVHGYEANLEKTVHAVDEPRPCPIGLPSRMGLAS